MDIQEIIEKEEAISEGAGHSGMSALVGVVAIKP